MLAVLENAVELEDSAVCFPLLPGLCRTAALLLSAIAALGAAAELSTHFSSMCRADYAPLPPQKLQGALLQALHSHPKPLFHSSDLYCTSGLWGFFFFNPLYLVNNFLY